MVLLKNSKEAIFYLAQVYDLKLGTWNKKIMELEFKNWKI